MTSPINEKEQYSFPAFEADPPVNHPDRRSSDEDGTLREEGYGMEDGTDEPRNHLRVYPSYYQGPDYIEKDNRQGMSPSAQREQSRRLDDDLEMLRAEREVSNSRSNQDNSIGRTRSMARSRSRQNVEPADDFDVDTTPIHEKTKIYSPPANPTTKFARFFQRIHHSSYLVRWFTYITPLALLLLVPIFLGRFVFPNTTVGEVRLLWFGIWLEIVWLTLWLGRLIAKAIPWPMGLISSLFTNSSKKWRDLGKALEVPATLFFWLLAIEISFLPTMKHHHLDGDQTTRSWEVTGNKIIVALFVGACLNFFEKIIIQLIAISFHLRTYADRIEVNKFQISSLVKLYIYSKEKIAMEDSEFEDRTGPSSGVRTPMAYVQKAKKNTRHVFNKVGDVAGKVAGDFIGQQVKTSTHPHSVVLQLLNTTNGSQVLARRLFRTFAAEHDESETVLADGLRPAFDNNDEADAAFTMFDKDLNGDISMEELEAVCVEIGRERKAITASLKDLDSVVSKLDDVFLFVVFVITVLVFLSLISTSAAGVLTSAGSTVLALSWLFSATAQEFLQSCIFVFVKHPFDVGDRVTVYGNTGSQMKGDDYFVKTISLLYTEFKKMEGHVVQAPNSYLNTIFILNQRRSGGLAEAVPVTVKFGTTLDQIDSLRLRLLEFVGSENREYQKNILTELTTIYEAYSITLNVVFFYKSNWQNELLRLQRRNKFICALMVTMNELGIEGPRMRLAGAAEEFPMYLNNAFPPQPTEPSQSSGPGPRSGSLVREASIVAPESSIPRNPTILRTRGSSNLRHRGESISAMGKRLDFSLGMSAISSGADFGDVYEDRAPRLPPQITTTSASPARTSRDSARNRSESQDGTNDGASLSMSDSRSSQFGKVTSGTSGKKHRNRFFSRRERSKLGTAEEGTNLDDLEAGTREFEKEDLPDIPEASGSGSGNWADETGALMGRRSGHLGGGGEGIGRGRRSVGEESARTDPRTGVVSPRAGVRDGTRDGELPLIGQGMRRAATEQVGRH